MQMNIIFLFLGKEEFLGNEIDFIEQIRIEFGHHKLCRNALFITLCVDTLLSLFLYDVYLVRRDDV